MNRLAVRIAIASLLAILLVGAAFIALVTRDLRGQAEERFGNLVERAGEQAAFQIQADAATRSVAASLLAGQSDFVASFERRDPLGTRAAAIAFTTRTGRTVDDTSDLRIYDANGVLLLRTEQPPAPISTQPVLEVVAVLRAGMARGLVRKDDQLGLVVAGIAPIFDSQRRPIGAVEAVTSLDDRYAALQAERVDTSVVFLLGNEVAGASPGADQIDSAVFTDELRARARTAPTFVPAGDSRYLASMVALRDPGDAPIGAVLTGVNESNVTDFVAELRAPIVEAMFVAIALATIATTAFSWLAVRPMARLTRAARRIQDNDLESPVPRAGPHEMRELAGAMDEMRRAVRQSREALLLANRELALRVAESTAGLSEVTQDLEVMQHIVADLAGESAGGLPAVAEELIRLDWVDGAFIALATARGSLSPAATAGVSPGAVARVIEAIETVAAGQSPSDEVTIEDTTTDGDGERLRGWFIGGFAAQPMVTPDGIAGVVCVVSAGPLTMTPQRRELLRAIAHEVVSRLERSELADEVEENRRLAEAVLREMSDGVVVIDQDGVCRICNPAAARLLARTRAEIVGHPSREWLPLPASALDTLRQRVAEGVPGGGAPLIATVGERQLAITAGPFHDPDPERSGLIVLIRDLSAEADAERLKRDFVAMVGHELRTPLTLIRTTIDLLHDGDAGALNPTQERIVEVLGQNSMRLMSLISDLLDMSALDSGRLHINPGSIDLGEVVQAAGRSVRPAAEARGHHLSVEAPLGTLVWADGERIGQVLANLLSNAIKYTPPGGEITVLLEDDQPLATVSVTDSGIGIRPEEQAHLFEKFYRTSSGRRATGTGLGLAIARSIIELHGGTISCHSDGEQGTTFTFTLPRRPV